MPGQTSADVSALAAEAGLAGVVLLGVANEPGDVAENVASFIYIPDLTTLDLGRVEADLAAGAAGIGELSIRHQATAGMDATDVRADLPGLLQLYDLASAYGVALNVHFEFEAGRMAGFEAALDHAPDVSFVWAHAGDASPDAVRPLLDAHANLFVDLSCRNPFYERGFDMELQSMADEEGGLDPDWHTLIVDHPDRFLVGTDVGPPGRDAQIVEVVAFYRGLFAQLEPEVADALASENARRVYGLSFGAPPGSAQRVKPPMTVPGQWAPGTPR